jgi:ribosome biogenesis GTPase
MVEAKFPKESILTGTVLRSHAGGYLVYQNELDRQLYCAARGRLKKEKVSIFAGDTVQLDDVNLELSEAVISACLPRKNTLSLPPLANVDQVVIVQAIHQPEWHPLWCDRFLVHFELSLPEASFILCFNKCDLANQDEIKSLKDVYESLGYKLHITSARTGFGLEELKSALDGKFSIFAGPSGVGKSTLLNALKPGLNLKTGIMENEYGVGRHTTTATEIYRMPLNAQNKPTWFADTPGFSIAELTHSQPLDIPQLFPEIKALADKCKFADCLHLVEQECNVLKNLSSINKDRYVSYMTLVNESKEKYLEEQKQSSKKESQVKYVGGKNDQDEQAKKVPRLNKRYRAISRRSEIQQYSPGKIDIDVSENEE